MAGAGHMADSFNYIAFANRDLVEGEVDTITISRGRLFEYTPTDIEKRLEALDAESIAYLENLPTFLSSEISVDAGGATMVVKYGRIGSVAATSKNVTAAFETLVDFGEVQFAGLDEAREVFEADGFQLHRTHWAVRTGDAQTILDKLAALKPDTAESVTAAAEAGAADSGAQPPARTKNIVGIADSVETFLQCLYGLDRSPDTETFFRGHADAVFELTPSLLRKRLDGSWIYMPNEDRLCKELQIAHDEEFHADGYRFDRLVRMQHYGLPTRLLDISLNPLVALFFTCIEMHETEGEVVIFQIRSDRIKYWDSDTVSCLANLSNLTYEQKNDIDLTLDKEAFNDAPVIRKLLHHIKSEKGFFEGRIVPDDLGSILCVKAKKTNNRIRSQSGAFLLFGHEVTLPDTGQADIGISHIRIANKLEILKQLDRLNINATTVYPGIEQTAEHLRTVYAMPSSPDQTPA